MPARFIRRATSGLRKKKALAKPSPRMGKAKAMPESKGKRMGRKIGAHLRRNKKLYAVGGAAGGIGYVAGRRSEKKRRR